MFCSNCGSGMAITAESCHACGESRAELSGKVVDSPRRKTHSLDLYQAIVGPKYQDYYLSRFSRFSETGHAGLTWHWPALFMTLPWLVYRKMWLYAALYFFLPYVSLVFGSTMLATLAKVTGVGDILAPVGLAAWIVAYLFLPPLLANGLYFDHCTDKITEAVAESESKERQIGALSARGGTSDAVAGVVAAFFMAVLLGTFAAVVIPAYQVFMGKEQLAQAEQYGRAAADSVARYYIDHDRLPEGLEQTGFKLPLPKAVGSISMNPDDGSLTIGILSQIAEIKGGSLVLAPSLTEEQEIVWSCWSDEIRSIYLSEDCRNADDSPNAPDYAAMPAASEPPPVPDPARMR